MNRRVVVATLQALPIQNAIRMTSAKPKVTQLRVVRSPSKAHETTVVSGNRGAIEVRVDEMVLQPTVRRCQLVRLEERHSVLRHKHSAFRKASLGLSVKVVRETGPLPGPIGSVLSTIMTSNSSLAIANEVHPVVNYQSSNGRRRRPLPSGWADTLWPSLRRPHRFLPALLE